MPEETPPGAQVSMAELIESIQNHRKIYLESDGAEGHLWDSSAGGGPGPVPTLLLTTTGRRSGEARIQPLIYGKTDAGYVVIASRGGMPTHPAWYLNLVAEPRVRFQVAREKFEGRARTADGAERAALWKHMVEIYPPYDDYQARTERVIPVVVLERQGG